MPTLVQLEYLLAVDKNRHFGQAAKECHVSQPSLSMQIQKLEEELGVILFDRSKKPILPTESGKAIVAQAKIVLREYKRLKEIALRGETELQGDFQLAVIPTLSTYIIPLFIKAFAEKYPKINLIINEHKTADIIKLLNNDEMDAGIIVTPLHDDHIIERVLFFEPFYLFSSKTHPFYQRRMINENELDGTDVWLLDEGHCFREQVIKICSIKGKKNVLKNISFASGNLETLKNLVRQNNGYTLLPFLSTLNLPPEEKQHMLKKFYKPIPTREVSLVHSRSFLKEDIIKALENEIIANLPDGLPSLKTKDIEVINID